MIVSAPNGTAENGVVENLGVLFECPINQGMCEPLIDSDDTDGNQNDRRLYDVDGEEIEVHFF